MKKTQANRSIRAAPTTMKMPRKIRARMMPHMSANCWIAGTRILPSTMMKTKRLSIDNEYSVR